jgi:adenosylmethionine-8-amino-7-oxononanoate aminotransferase
MVGTVNPAHGSAPFVVTPLEHDAVDHVWVHALSWREQAEEDGFRVFERGRNATLWDSRGEEFLDVISGLWVVNVGHGRKAIARAMGEQAEKLAYASVTAFTTEPTAKLAAKLAEITPGDLNRVFFVSGGSESVETAVKIAKQVQAMRGFPRRYKVIARRGSYHGMTQGALSLTDGRNEEWFGPFQYGVYHAPHPNRYRSDFGVEGEQADLLAANWVESEIIAQGPETVAAVIGETISCSAGVHVPSTIYWQRLREICDKHGVLLIADEVINGFGRTGTMFAIEQYGIVPDIMTIAKGMSSGYAPIGAALVRDEVFQIFKEQSVTPLGHALTFGGHPVSAAAALRNIQIIEEEDLVRQSAEKGAYLLAELDKLRSHPSVGDVRGVGLFTAVDLVKNKQTKESFGREHPFSRRVHDELFARGLVTRVWDVIHVAPPLVVTKDELDRIVTAIDEALTIAERGFSSELSGD